MEKPLSIDENPTAKTRSAKSSRMGRAFWSDWLIAFFHGILTGRTNPTWPDFGRAFFQVYAPGIIVITDYYFELIFPRLAAIRNRKRIERNAETMDLHAKLHLERTGQPPRLDFGGHSNGGILAVGVAREMIERGYPVRRILLMAPALRATHTTRELVDWMERGMLDRVLLVRATKDRTLSLANSLPRIVCWPWGVLGLKGWDENEIPEELADRFNDFSLPVGHTEFLEPQNREETFRTIIAPFFEIDIEDETQPEETP